MEDVYGVNEYYDSNVTYLDDWSTANYDEYRLRFAYVGWWDPATSTYKHKYDQSPYIDESWGNGDRYTVGPNEDCPNPILPLTSTRQDIEDHVAALEPIGATNTAIGAIWGWRVVSPEAPFTEGEDYGATGWKKSRLDYDRR